MPMPTPGKDEGEDDFIGRCMGDSSMVEDYPENDQRAAVCHGQWRDRSAQPQGKHMTTLSEKLRQLKRERAQMATELCQIVERAEGDDAPPEDETAARFKEVHDRIDGHDDRITRIESAMAAEAALATEQPGEGGNGDTDAEETALTDYRRASFRLPAQVRKKPKQGPGLRAARFVLGVMHARISHVSLAKAAEFIMNRFGDEVVARALNYTNTGEGGALIPQDFLADMIELLRAATAVRGANPMEVGMPMGNLTIPRLAGGATAAYQGELDDIQLSQERFDDVNLVAKKLTALVPVSNDLIRRAPIGVEEIVRDDLVQTIARKEDLAFLRGDGLDKGPVGMRNLALPANVITVPAMPAVPAPGDTVTAILDGASAAILALQNGMSRMIRPVWIMAPTTARFIATARDQVGGFYFKDDIAANRFEGYPIRLTQQIPTNLSVSTYTKGSEVYFVDMADFIIADTMNVIVDASDVAAYNDGTSIVSAFQRDQSLFRVISEHDVNMRHLQSLVVLLTQDWGFTAVPGLPGAPFSTQPLNPTWSQAPAIRPAIATGADAPPALSDPA